MLQVVHTLTHPAEPFPHLEPEVFDLELDVLELFRHLEPEALDHSANNVHVYDGSEYCEDCWVNKILLVFTLTRTYGRVLLVQPLNLIVILSGRCSIPISY